MATWLSTLPSPSTEGYAVNPAPQTLRTDMEGGMPRSRRISSARNDRVTAMWEFTDAQMGAFRSWFGTEALGGAGWFLIDLALGNGGITRVEARFVSGYNHRYRGYLAWTVSAELEIR